LQIGLEEEFSISNIWVPDADINITESNLQTPNFQLNRAGGKGSNVRKISKDTSPELNRTGASSDNR